MKMSLFNLIMFVGSSTMCFSQSKPTIAVSNPSVLELYATPTLAAKLLRLELIKLEQYSVYDEFEMLDLYQRDTTLINGCQSSSCLAKLGKELGVDYVLGGSFDYLGNKIVITLKIIDTKNGSIYKTGVKEFDDQEKELQRMIQLLLEEMHGVIVAKEINEKLKFQNELISSNDYGRINNSGPRIGVGLWTGNIAEFAQRSTSRGGLDIVPIVSQVGYQLEGQYIGTENFSALIEGIIMFTGLEQGQFIPSLTLMNGFRFGKAGWEFGFGPGFGYSKGQAGFIDRYGSFGEEDKYYAVGNGSGGVNGNPRTDNDLAELYASNPTVDPAELLNSANSMYGFKGYADTRGELKMTTMFVFAFGRTFRAGALNIPVNVFYSSRKGGGMVGLNVGFNVMKSKKKPINRTRVNI